MVRVGDQGTDCATTRPPDCTLALSELCRMMVETVARWCECGTDHDCGPLYQLTRYEGHAVNTSKRTPFVL